MLTLATWSDAHTGIIPDKHTPSLSVLASTTGYSKSTVARWLSRLEVAGWVRRERPDVKLARAKHLRTRYRLTIAEGPHANDSKPPTEQEHAECEACPPAGHMMFQTDEARPASGHGDGDEASPGGRYGDDGHVRHADTAGSGSRTRPVSGNRTEDNLDLLNPEGHWFLRGPGGFCRVCGQPAAEHHNRKGGQK